MTRTIDIAAARAALAPTGILRAGLNLSNFLLVQRDPSNGAVSGVAPDLAREIAGRLGIDVKFVPYPSPGAMAAEAQNHAWDIALMGAEPDRATVIDFTDAYVEIDATYLVPAGSPLRTIEEVDAPGVRICAFEKSAYELYLRRTLKHATLVTEPEGIEASFRRFVADKLDALAGLRPRHLQDLARVPGARVLEGRFTAVQQGIGTPKGRQPGTTTAIEWLREFVDDVKSRGLAAELIERHGIVGLTPTR